MPFVSNSVYWFMIGFIWSWPLTFTVPPPRDDTLPDLFRLLESLEEGETELVTKRDPPPLFLREEHVPKYERISGK